MTRSEHKRIVGEQQRKLERYDAEMNRVLTEAQAWVERLRRLLDTLKEGQTDA